MFFKHHFTEHLQFFWFQILQIPKMSVMSLDQLFNSPKLVAPICEDSDREVKRAAMQACACGDKFQDLQKCGRHIKKDH